MKKLRHTLRRLPGWSQGRDARLAWIFLLMVGLLAFVGPWIANERPFRCTLDGKTYYPIFSGVSEATLSVAHPAHSPVKWNSTAFEKIWRAPVPYSYHTLDLETGALVSPVGTQKSKGRFRHWLGTDTLGRDVLAGMIRGCRVSLLIGLGAMLLATCIGVPLGAISAYWGNTAWRISYGQLLCILISIVAGVWVWFIPIPLIASWLATLIITIFMILILWRSMQTGRQRIPVPLDQVIMGSVSIIDGFPALFLILVIVAILPVKGWVVLMLTIALLRWPSMARYMRAEVFRMREMNFVKAAQVLNLSSFHILFRHVIPFAFRPVMISFIFGVSSAILAESSLSFLGIGLPAEEMNWGRLLAQSRNHFDAWWLVLLPGSAIFLTLLSLYTIGNAYQRGMVSEA